MTNSDFWKSQFIKHHAVPGPSKPPAVPAATKPSVRIATKPVSTKEMPLISSMEEMLRSVRSTQSKLSFEKFVSLVLLKFPAKARAQWEQWLLNQKASLVKKWNLSE